MSERAACERVRVATFAGPGSGPVIREVPVPAVPRKAALIRIAACGVCGTDLHILAGHWPKPLPWPFTLGHELAGVVSAIGPDLTEDHMGRPLAVGTRVMLPPLMPCGSCYYCVHYPQTANKCLTPVYYGRYLGFQRPPHLWGGWAEHVYVDLEELPGTKVYALPDDMPACREAKALMARKEALLLTEGAAATDEIKRIWTRLDELQEAARSDFPLTAAESQHLLSDLQQRIRRVYDLECAAHEALGAYSGA